MADPAVPILAFVIVFGLSMDYEVFLMARVAEARRSGFDEGEAVAPTSYPASEWPSKAGFQPKVDVIAWGRIESPDADAGREVGLVSAYDPNFYVSGANNWSLRIQRCAPPQSTRVSPASGSAALAGGTEIRHSGVSPSKKGRVCSRSACQKLAPSSSRSPPSEPAAAVTPCSKPDSRTYRRSSM